MLETIIYLILFCGISLLLMQIVIINQARLIKASASIDRYACVCAALDFFVRDIEFFCSDADLLTIHKNTLSWPIIDGTITWYINKDKLIRKQCYVDNAKKSYTNIALTHIINGMITKVPNGISIILEYQNGNKIVRYVRARNGLYE